MPEATRSDVGGTGESHEKPHEGLVPALPEEVEAHLRLVTPNVLRVKLGDLITSALAQREAEVGAVVDEARNLVAWAEDYVKQTGGGRPACLIMDTERMERLRTAIRALAAPATEGTK